MAIILILRHQKLDRLLNLLLVKKNLPLENTASYESILLIAPEDFCAAEFNPETLKTLIENLNDVQLIFYEANLGYPSREKANKEALKILTEKYPQAVIVLKSNTEKAIHSAQHFLLDKLHLPSEQVTSILGKDILTKEVKNIIQEMAIEDTTPDQLFF